MLLRRLVLISSFCGPFALAACTDDPVQPPVTGQAGVKAVLGNALSDTVDAISVQALVAEVRRDNGDPAVNVVVRFQAQPPADTTRRLEPALFVCGLAVEVCGPTSGPSFAVDTTDAQGRAKALVRFGHVAGRAVVRMSVPELGLADSASFDVRAGNGVRVRAPAVDTGFDIGQTAVLRARLVDRYGNPRTEAVVPSLGSGTALSLNATTGAVTALNMGMQLVFFRFQSLVDSTNVRVLPAGRLLVWTAPSAAVRMVDINGTNTRTVITSVSSDLGVFPRFDASRQRISLHAGPTGDRGPSALIIVADTTGTPRRDIADAFTQTVTRRAMADGSLLVVGQRSGQPFALWRVATDNTIAQVATLPAMTTGSDGVYGGADVSPDGSKVAYIASGTNGFELRVLNVATGIATTVDGNSRSPRWSQQGDRIAYLSNIVSSFDGAATVINGDGTNRKVLGTSVFSPGLGWSPDGQYVIGRSSGPQGLRVIRISDLNSVLLTFRSTLGGLEDYYQPDWR